jgi:hypothetical protein
MTLTYRTYLDLLMCVNAKPQRALRMRKDRKEIQNAPDILTRNASATSAFPPRVSAVLHLKTHLLINLRTLGRYPKWI